MASFWCSNIGGFDCFGDVGGCFAEVIEARLSRFGASSADILHDISQTEVEVLVNYEVPYLDLPQLVVIGVRFVH